jgi:hypothetical protein
MKNILHSENEQPLFETNDPHRRHRLHSIIGKIKLLVLYRDGNIDQIPICSVTGGTGRIGKSGG